jgi:hypothetical protein
MDEPIPEPDLIDSRLKLRLWLFLLIAVGMIIAIGYEIYEGEIGPFLAVLGVAIGVAAGYVFGRLWSVRWHPEKAKVVSELDLIGGIALAVYFALDYERDWIFGHFIHGPALGAFTLALLAGALFGRFLGMRISIVRVLAGRKRRKRVVR